MEAGGGRADLLIATTSSDEINILACLVAKKMGVQHTIARIRNPEYEKQLRFMREELGLSMSINPERAAAREIARVLRFPAAMKVETFSKGRLELVEYRVPEDSALAGVQLLNLYKSLRVRVLICAVSRKGETIIPSGDFVLQSGDKIYLTSSSDQLAQFFRHLGVFRNRASTVMIVGASKICYYLASDLLEMGMDVKIIDQSESRCISMGERLPKALVIVGDGTDTELLRAEGSDQTDALVASTGIDEANILMAMSASKQAEKCKVVAKITSKSLEELVRIYESSVGGNAAFLLNVPPAPEGLIHETDAARLRELGAYLRETYRHNLAENAQIAREENRITVRWETPVEVFRIVLMEDIARSQRVESFSILDGEGKTLYEGTVIGYKKIIPLQRCLADQITVRIRDSRGTPHIAFVGVY